MFQRIERIVVPPNMVQHSFATTKLQIILKRLKYGDYYQNINTPVRLSSAGRRLIDRKMENTTSKNEGNKTVIWAKLEEDIYSIFALNEDKSEEKKLHETLSKIREEIENEKNFQKTEEFKYKKKMRLSSLQVKI
jgi:hypothetical protein